MPADEVDEDFGQRVRKRREELDLNQTQLGTLAGVHRATIRALEIGKNVEGKTLTNVLRALGCWSTVMYYDDPIRLELKPVFTAGVAGLVARAILSGLAEQEPESDTEGAEQKLNSLIADYYELVDAAARARDGEGRYLPDSFQRLRNGLPLTGSQLRMLDWELSMVFGKAYPYPPEPTPPERTITVTGPATAGKATGYVAAREDDDTAALTGTVREARSATDTLISQIDRHGELSTRGWWQVDVVMEALRMAISAPLPSSVQVGLAQYALYRAKHRDHRLRDEIQVMIAGLMSLDLPDQVSSVEESGYGDGDEGS